VISSETLTFLEYIGSLPHELVFKYLLRGNGTGRKIVSSTTCRELAHRHALPDALSGRFAALSADDRKRCAAAYLAGRSGLPASAIGNFSDPLLKSFLAYPARDDSGRLYYLGFDEFADALKPHLLQTLAGNHRRPGADDAPRDYLPWYCLNDCVMAAVLAGHDIVRLTKGNTFAKSSLEAFAETAHDVPSGLPHAPHQCLGLLLDYCLDAGIVYERDGKYAVNHQVLHSRLMAPLAAWHRDFLRFCMERLGGLREDLLLSLVGAGRPPAGIADMTANRSDDAALDAARLLAYTGVAGILRIGAAGVLSRSRHYDAFVNNTSGPAPTRSIVVTPDFAAIIPQEVSPPDLYWFLRIGTISSLDKIYKGTIERATICESLVQGISGDELLSQLSRWQTPGNIVATVKEWVREFTRLSVDSGSFVISAEAAISAQLISYAPLRQCVEPVPAHSFFKVKKGRERQVWDLLQTLGFDPRTPQDTPSAGDAGAPAAYAPVRRPVADFGDLGGADVPERAPSGKYSSEMKKLELNDLFHVLDYAILMGYQVKVEYRGSPGIRRGAYLLHPESYQKGAEPQLIGQTKPSGTVRTFIMKQIDTIGVLHA